MATQDRPTGKLDRLTQSERECLRMVAQHMRSKEIARSRGTSPFTVNRQIESACRKLGAATRQDAARIWISVEGEPAPHMPTDSAYDSLGIVNVPPSASVHEATETVHHDHNDDFDHDGDHQLHLETARIAAQGIGGKPVPHMVSGLAKQYLFLEESLLLSEIMKMAVCVADPNFRRAELLRSTGSASPEGSCSLP
jgi:DNA-binding CsgD family transcriptional regulator